MDSGNRLFIDIETYSDADISLGVHKYVDASVFEILLMAYAFNDEPVEVIDFKAGETLPGRVICGLQSPLVRKSAFHANFELTCLKKFFPKIAIKPMHWDCDSVLALYHSYPPGLGVVAECLGLAEDQQKDKRGKRLIQYFCKPCKPTKKNGGRTRNLPEHAPEDWAVFKNYCRQDVVTERAIHKALCQLTPTEKEHVYWLVDRRINDRGIAIDTDLVKGAIKLNEELQEKLEKEAVDITGLANPNSVAQLKEFFALNGHPMESLNKEAVNKLLDNQALHPTLRRVLEIRQQLGKTSIKKYTAMINSICSDGRAHDLFQFYGASRTGRWAGRNIQLQNLTKNHIEDLDEARAAVKTGDLDWVEMMYGNVSDLLSQLVRTALIPKPGYKFVVADFSAIEARVLAWLANEKWRREAFAAGEDIYCSSASRMFGVPVVKHGVNGELRQKGKVAELALGYGGGIVAMKQMGGDRLNMTDGELSVIVTKWRLASPKIVDLWYDLDAAAKRCIKHGGKKMVIRDKHVYFEKSGDDLLLKLPSGRKLVYLNAGMGENRFGSPSIVYEGMVQQSHKWGDLETYGGKLTENLVQAVARDCLAAAMLRLEKAGYGIVGHVHDEVICEVPDTAEYSLDKAVKLMTENEPWMRGLLLNADGFESYYYKKD